MATHAVAVGERGAYEKKLTAETVDSVVFAYNVDEVEITSDGAAAVYLTVDGSTPTVGGAATWHLPPVACTRTIDIEGGAKTTVKLISAGTPTVSVAKAGER